MRREEFFEEIRESVEEIAKRTFGDDTDVKLGNVMKINGVEKHGIMILEKGKGISPNIYLDEFYEQLHDSENAVERTAEEVMKIYETNKNPLFNMTDVFSKENVKNNIYCVLINAEKNQKLLEEVPHRLVEDLAITYRLGVNLNGMYDNANILIRNEHLDLIGITAQELDEMARENTRMIHPPKLFSMLDIMKDSYKEILKKDSQGVDEEEIDILADNFIRENILDHEAPMYVLTNQNKYYGAYYMIDEKELAKIAEQLGADLYILPSSVHECIIIPNADMRREEENLLNMVKEVNASMVSEEEILADSVYYFDRQLGGLSVIATESNQIITI